MYVYGIVFTKLRYARRLLHTKLIILRIACDGFIYKICIEYILNNAVKYEFQLSISNISIRLVKSNFNTYYHIQLQFNNIYLDVYKYNQKIH